MDLVLHGVGTTRLLAFNPGAKTLGALLAPHQAAVDLCTVNGQLLIAWEPYVPQADDRLEVWLRPGGGLGEIAIAILISLAVSMVTFGITYGLGLLLQNRPDPTKEQAKPEETFGIAGLSNTIALGTPKVLLYGQRRSFGHLIGSSVQVQGTRPPGAGSGGYGSRMGFGALYYMGEGEMEAIKAVEINEIALANYPGTRYEVRRGAATQTAIAVFAWAQQVYSDGRELPRNTGIVYQTRGDLVDQLLLIFAVPYLQKVEQGRTQTSINPGHVTIRIEYKTVAATTWTRFHMPTSVGGDGNGNCKILANTQGGFFFQVNVVLPAKHRYQVRLTVLELYNENDATPSLYNVQEIDRRLGDAQLTYPNSAVLAVTGIASSQITSFEGMKVSALVLGRKVITYNSGVRSRRFSRNRVWIVRDLLTDPRVGMGHRIPESLWDEPAAISAATYYMGEIGGEARDYCDLVLNQRRPGWDWIRDLLTEGNAALVPSQGRLKYVIDRPQTARLAYMAPGNVLQDSVMTTIGSTGQVPNTVRGEFPDQAQNYRLSIIELQAADIGDELLLEQTTSLKTITRLSQAQRSLAYALKKQRLVQRRYSWQSPLAALVSEPFDVVRLGYLTPARRHGLSGYLQDGSTALRLLLDQLVPLQAGATYEVLIKMQRSNEVFVRTFIAGATREHVSLDIAPALATVPQAGDLYAVGLLAQSMVTVLLDSLSLDTQEQTYTVSGAEYRAEIYDTSGTGAVPNTASAFHDLPALYAEDLVTRYHASYQTDDPEAILRTEGMEPWPGAQLFRSRDVEEEYDLSYQGAPLPCMGTAVTVLPAPSVGYARTDLVSTVEVDVQGGILTSLTSTEWQMGFNHLLIGQELLTFRIAESLGVVAGFRRYRLRHLRRGRRGTEYAVGTHQAGERVLLIGTGVFTKDILRSERQRTRHWKTPTVGQDVTDVPPRPYAVPSQNLRPWTVGSAWGRQRSDGTWLLRWRGRARFLGDWVDGEEAVPDYDVHYYALAIYGDASRATIVHRQELGQPSDYQVPITYQYSATQQMADFGSIQTTLHWECQQVGTDDVSVPLGLVSVAGEET